MALTLTLDAPLRLQLEPGYRHLFSAGELAQAGGTLSALSARNLWVVPGTGSIQLKPLQLFPEFLNHQAQLDAGAVVRYSDFFFNSQDKTDGGIVETLTNPEDPWIMHVPATTLLDPPTKTVAGIQPIFENLQDLAELSELGLTGSFDTTPALPDPAPLGLVWLGFTTGIFARNTGWLFRWYQPAPQLDRHPTMYAFVFAQYCALCRGALLEVFERTGSDRTNWVLRYREALFAPGKNGVEVNTTNPSWATGRSPGDEQAGHYASLMVIPCSRQKVLFQTHAGAYFIANVRAHPRRTADNAEWDILQEGSVSVWALTPEMGRFQVQKIVYVAPPGTVGGAAPALHFPNIMMDYTPAIFPTLQVHGDHDAGSTLTAHGPTFPKDYTFPQSPLSDDCPDPTTFGTARGRTFGASVVFTASPDQRRSPELYKVEVVSEPVFQQNSATAFLLQDQFAGGSAIQHGDLSLGSNPGDGRLTLATWDTSLPTPANPNGYPLAPYRYRCEIPIQLAQDGQFAFTGYTDRIEVEPLRQDPVEDPNAPVEFRFRCNDRWLLLEETILREQRDWQGIGHIGVVDTIVRQCGIDTGPLHPTGETLTDDSPFLAGGSLAEYPTGWDGARASLYNTPLGTPILTADNLEGNQLLGWKPQPHDTGATFLERIRSLFSNWLMGFRADGTFYYLPYTYFATSSVTFHTHSDRSVDSGAHFNAALNVGLNLFISGGQVTIGGQSASFGDLTLLLPDNSESTVYAQQTGTGVQIVHNTTNIPPKNAVTIGQAITASGQIAVASDGPESGRQVKGGPIARRPVEYRTIEPTGNYVQVVSHYQLDQTANRSGIFVDWASILNPKAVNFLGRPKWLIVEAGGAFSCAQLNRMAYIAFQAARRRRLRVSFDGTYVPTLKIGQVVTLEGEGDFRLLEMRVSFTRKGWSIANYVAERVEAGYGLPS